MQITRSTDGSWALTMGAETLLTGSAEKPFALALRRKKHSTANRGVVKTEIVELERVPL